MDWRSVEAPSAAPRRTQEARAGAAAAARARSRAAQSGGIFRYGSAKETIFWKAGAATEPP